MTMTLEQFENLFDIHDDLSTKYMFYIQENADPEEYMICNGDDLLMAAEDGYLFKDFYEYCMSIGIENI